MSTVKKVGGDTTTKAPKEPKTSRPEFDLATATLADGKAVPGRTEGKLKDVPHNYDSQKFKPLKATAFSDRSVYMEFKAMLMERGIQDKIEQIAQMRHEATKLRALGDDATRKKASKLMKHREALAKLEAEFLQDGFDMSLLD